MLTVGEALQLKQFHGARIVAGEGGIDRPVSWVHVASVPDAPVWLNGGELVLTTAINLPDDPVEQVRYLQAMADKGVAALALAVGRYIDEAPRHLRVVADLNDFPLIEIPFQARFVDIAKTINERIAQEHMALVERALHIHHELTKLALDSSDLKALAETLAKLIGQSVSIENERFEALASANIAAFDEARRYTLSEGRTDPRLVSALEERGFLGEIRRTLRPVFIPQMADVGLEMERILAPIVVHGDLYGYVWIIADDRPLSDIDRMAIESGATIAALMLLHQEAIQVAEASLKGGLIAQLIAGEGGREAVLTDQALRYGLDLSAPYVLVVIDTKERNSQKLLQIYRRVNRLAGTQRWQAVVSQFAGQVVVLAQVEMDIPALVEQIHTQSGNGGIHVGVSAVQRGAERVPTAYGQCLDVLYINRRLSPARQTAYFDDLGYLHTLYKAGADSLKHNPFAPALRRLTEPHLLHTLEAYLDEGGNSVQAARALHIHRSTLNYRLDQIRETCGFDLSDPVIRTNIQIALKLLRLFEDPS